jgi:hypothetical protein
MFHVDQYVTCNCLWALCPSPMAQVCFNSHNRLICVERTGVRVYPPDIDIAAASSPCLLYVILVGPRANAELILQTTRCTACSPPHIKLLVNAALRFLILKAICSTIKTLLRGSKYYTCRHFTTSFPGLYILKNVTYIKDFFHRHRCLMQN